MQLRRIISTFTLIIMLGCKNIEQKKSINVKDEISQINSLSDKENYLEYIHNSDQEIRDGRISEIKLKYGENSNEAQNFVFKMDSVDKLNLKRIDNYLKTFGYPSSDSFSRNACVTPWLVIHHQTDVNLRKKYFKYLHDAYKNNHISSDLFQGYLGRTYQFEFGNYSNEEGPYFPEDKINKLIKELSLE